MINGEFNNKDWALSDVYTGMWVCIGKRRRPRDPPTLVQLNSK